MAVANNVLYVSDNGVNGVYELDATTGARIRFIYDLGVSEPAFVAVSTVPEPATWTLLILLGGAFALPRLGINPKRG